MKKDMRARLKSEAGESIGETLVALLIGSLALLMLAGAVSSAGRIVNTSKTAMEDYYAAESNMVAGSSLNVTVTGLGTYRVNSYQNEKAAAAFPVVKYDNPQAM